MYYRQCLLYGVHGNKHCFAHCALECDTCMRTEQTDLLAIRPVVHAAHAHQVISLPLVQIEVLQECEWTCTCRCSPRPFSQKIKIVLLWAPPFPPSLPLSFPPYLPLSPFLPHSVPASPFLPPSLPLSFPPSLRPSLSPFLPRSLPSPFPHLPTPFLPSLLYCMQDAIARVQTLLEAGELSGVVDDRGKFIYISREELESMARFIRQRGRVSLAELVSSSNTLINLQPEAASVTVHWCTLFTIMYCACVALKSIFS